MQQGVQTVQYPTMLRPFTLDFILLTTRNAKQEIQNKKIPHSISAKVSQLFKGCYILRQKLVTFRVKKLLLLGQTLLHFGKLRNLAFLFTIDLSLFQASS